MSDNDIVDLTASDNEQEDARRPTNPRHATSLPSNDPIGVELSADIVDLAIDDDDMPGEIKTDELRPLTLDHGGIRQQTHPRKVIAASLKQKRERKAAEEAHKRERERFVPESFPGGCNFVVIDDSSDEEVAEDADDGAAFADAFHTHKPSAFKRPRERKKPRYQPKKRPEEPFSYFMSDEDASNLQERLFRESAARLRAQAIHHTRSGPSTFEEPVFDVAERFPDHWRWKEPYSCLGLPANSPLVLVKSQYRRLARVYHPDKSKLANTASKFHGIALAYRKLNQID